MKSDNKANVSSLEVYQNLAHYNIGLAYSGIFTDDLTDNFIRFCDDILINQKNDPKTAKTIDFILCETFQNIVRHTSTDESVVVKKDYTGYFSFHNIKNDYRINSINFIQEEDKQKAVTLIENVNSKSSEELRALYREKLNDGSFSEKGGAGLGFIQIARKTGKNILYKISNTDIGIDQLHQQVMISEKAGKQHTNRIEMSHEQFEDMIVKHDILQYKGDFSEERLDSISRIVNANLRTTEHIESKKEKIERCFKKMFNNVKEHGAMVDGMKIGSLVVAKQGDIFTIEMGNPIALKDVEKVKTKLASSKIIPNTNSSLSSIQELISADIQFEFETYDLDDQNAFLVVRSSVCN